MAAPVPSRLIGLGDTAEHRHFLSVAEVEWLKNMVVSKYAAGNAPGLAVVSSSNGDEFDLTLDITTETEVASRNGGPEAPPLVFICTKCKRVMGDSTSWIESDLDDQAVMLKDVSRFVIKDEEPTLSTTPQDNCCLVENLFCSGCNTCIGKIYKSTPKHLDYKRELFCIDVDTIESYPIGSISVQEIADKDEPSTLELRSEIETELMKIKAVLLVLKNDLAIQKSKKL